MTKSEIMALSGRELDVAVAIGLFGWTWAPDEVFAGYVIPLERYRRRGVAFEPEAVLRTRHANCPMPVPKYSTDIAAAWLVVERMQERWRATRNRNGWDWAFYAHRGNTWCVVVTDGYEGTIIVESELAPLPEATCRAALLALEAERD